MIQSMTGFGKSLLQLPSKKITIEIKSLNSKSLDLNARIPGQYREKELLLRKLIAKSLVRGKVDFSLYVEVTGEETTASVNPVVVKKYMEQLREIANADDAELLKMAIRMPDTMKTEREEIDETEFIKIKNTLKEALTEINSFRTDEGNALEKDLLFRVSNIAQLLQDIIAMDPDRIEGVRERLRKGVAELQEKVDENRFEQELVFYIEKFDITEEKVRLENHLSYFLETINSSDSNGRKLGFISQEMGREINTIGSKSNYAPMQQLVVQMKDELEKIKEQLLNVL
ncbi:YicC/YloC family endoribonuclease [Gillisia marina]|uniref:YicC/YloC family endoribonuclease n=1 Tax=Gillisia marina TaxID=1167637 RepID=UPI00029A43CA|nr:YicC/YloC family endoribonuclease [Gillisia marina]